MPKAASMPTEQGPWIQLEGLCVSYLLREEGRGRKSLGASVSPLAKWDRSFLQALKWCFSVT